MPVSDKHKRISTPQFFTGVICVVLDLRIKNSIQSYHPERRA